MINSELVKMKEGECWYCNFNKLHEVYKNSKQHRAHLIMDCMVNDWLKALIKEG